MDALFQSFQAASQEPVRLRLAVECYFGGTASPEQTRTLEGYLRRRIRSVIELLLQEDALPRLERLAAEGWLNPGLVEDGLDMAIRRKKTEGIVWLLGWKAEHYGFADRDFSL